MNRVDLRLIRAFCAVYEEGSINRAAARLRVAQPNISVAIKNLEIDLRTKLFHRDTSGATPTAAGRTFYTRVKKVLFELDAAHLAVFEGANDLSGPLRVGLPAMIARTLGLKLLPLLLSEHPDIDFRFVEGTPQWLIDLTLSGELEFAVVLTPPAHPRLEQRWLASEPFVLVSSMSGEISTRTPVDLREFPPLKLALPWGQGSVRNVIDSYISSGEIPVNRIVGISALDPIIALVKDTDWMTILPATIMTIELEGLVGREIAFPDTSADFYIIRPVGSQLSSAAQLFITEIEKTFESTARVWKHYLGHDPDRVVNPVKLRERSTLE
ncbi:MAG: LysR family transcriptional regulator [Sphingobium sp.]